MALLMMMTDSVTEIYRAFVLYFVSLSNKRTCPYMELFFISSQKRQCGHGKKKYPRRIYGDDRPTSESATFYLPLKQNDKLNTYKFSFISILLRRIFNTVLQNSRTISEIFKQFAVTNCSNERPGSIVTETLKTELL